jgi:hypothetical protein
MTDECTNPVLVSQGRKWMLTERLPIPCHAISKHRIVVYIYFSVREIYIECHRTFRSRYQVELVLFYDR